MAKVSNKASVSVRTSNQYEPKAQASDSSTFKKKKEVFFVLICMMSQRGDIIRDTMIIQHFHDA